jgi:hypothetical protein
LERFGGIGKKPFINENLGDVRPPRRCTRWHLRVDLLPRNVVIALETLHHEAQTIAAVVANFVHLGCECGVCGIWKIPQQMNAARWARPFVIEHLATQFNPGENPKPRA